MTTSTLTFFLVINTLWFARVINERAGGVANGSKFRPNRIKKAYRDRGLLCIKLFCVISDDRLQYIFATACTNTVFLLIALSKNSFSRYFFLDFTSLGRIFCPI